VTTDPRLQYQPPPGCLMVFVFVLGVLVFLNTVWLLAGK
jgi:hypothetical protein